MRILVIGDNDVFARWVIVCLASAGHRVRAMTPGTRRLARLSRYCEAHLACDSETLRRPDASLLDRINAYCREHEIQWIVPADLPATLLLARERNRLRVPGIFPVSE